MVYRQLRTIDVRWKLLLSVQIVISSWFIPSVQTQTPFADVATQVGITTMHNRSLIVCSPNLGSGSAWADYDNDGDIDLYITNQGGPCYLYRNDGDSNGDSLPDFAETAAAAGVDNAIGIGHSGVFVDFDNDGDQDLFVTNWGSNILFKNQLMESGSPTFVDATTTANLTDYGRTITSAWGDYDGDGYLDVYLAKHRYCPPNDLSEDQLYRNNGDGTFTNVTGLLCPGGIAPCSMTNGLGFTAGWVDYDNDADVDLYLANDHITDHAWPNVLWRNDGTDGVGGWIFTDVSMSSGVGTTANSMGLGVGDYDNDGFMDLAFSDIGPNNLLKNNGDGTFADVSASAGIQRGLTQWGDTSVTWGTVFFDYDNDQWMDLFIVAGMIGPLSIRQPDILFRNNGDGTFEDISAASGIDDTLRGRSASIVDLDEDGFVDLFVGNLYSAGLGNLGPFRVFHNRSKELGNTNHWLTVTVEGTTSNRDGIGTRLYSTTPDGITQIRDITSGPTYGGGDYRAAYFGLGTNTTTALSVRWPTGVINDLGTVSADQEIHIVEGIPCDDITSMLARCTGSGMVQARVVFRDNIEHSGETVLFEIDGVLYPAVIGDNGVSSRASISVSGLGVGDHTVSLVDPPECLDPRVVTCLVAKEETNLEWDADDARWSIETALAEAQAVSKGTRLIGSYPNPFNPSTTIRYTLSGAAHVRVTVYNMLGQRVATLVDESQSAGNREVAWDGSNDFGQKAAGGIYIYRLTAGDFVATQRMILLK